MDDAELTALLQDLESDRVERKVSSADGERLREAICAFANDLPNHRQPGVLFIGVSDDGSCAHLAITDTLLTTLAGMRSDGNITPFPTMTVQKKNLYGCEVAVIVVEPADAPPVRCRGRVWVRVGPRRAIATPEEERRLTEKRRSKDLPFDVQPVTSATLDDLDLEIFRREYLPAMVPADVLEQNQRSSTQQLASMRFITVELPIHPTVLGLLTVGKEPRQALPGAYIQFLRFDGTTLTDPIRDQKDIDGPLPTLLRTLDEIFHAHIAVALDITAQLTDVRHPEYPMIALQQLARNAVLHRTYEGTHAPVRITWFNDRIEIQNPGGPFGQVTRQNFGQPGITDYRNPHLAEAMKTLGYVQRFGIGIALAQRELHKNGNPPLEFDIQDAHVLAIVKRRL